MRGFAVQTLIAAMLATSALIIYQTQAAAYKLPVNETKNVEAGNSTAIEIKKGAAGRAENAQQNVIASDLPMRVPMVLPRQDSLPKPKRPILSAVMDTTIKAPLPFVWNTLTDFSVYPKIFPRIESVKVTKCSGNYIYTESYLKPQLFVKEQRQHIVNDLSGKPHTLRWSMIDGDFEYTQGCWELTSSDNAQECKVKYTLQSTVEPIPKPIANFTLKMVQRDIVKSFKRGTEKLYQTQAARSNGGPLAFQTTK